MHTAYGMIAISAFRVVAVTLLSAQAVILTACSSTVESSDPYASKVRFAVDRTLRFRDFEMTYVGKRHETPPQYPQGWWIHDFKVRSKGGEQTVSWSAGTGDIGPVSFKVDGAPFQIELSHSDKLGKLGEDELVISPVAVSQ